MNKKRIVYIVLVLVVLVIIAFSVAYLSRDRKESLRTEATKEYKQIVSKTFTYGNKTNEQFGIFRDAGGQGPFGIFVDSEGKLYINDRVNEKIKYIDPNLTRIEVVKDNSANLSSKDKSKSYSEKTYRTFANPPEIHIASKKGKESVIEVSEPDILSLQFLTEDAQGNAYFVAEIDHSQSDGIINVAVKVLVYNPSGELVTTLLLPDGQADIYSETGLVHVDQRTGDIWQFAPLENNLLIARWSKNY